MKEQPIAERIALDLVACKAAFDKVRIPWFIIDGIVLGYARDRAIIKWDTDIDMAVFVKVSAKQWIQLYKSLRIQGFQLSKTWDYFVWGRRLSKLNLWFFRRKGKYYESYPRTTPGLKFVEKARWFEKPQMVEFLGKLYPMPNHLEEYLKTHYGSDWRVEKPGHANWRVEKFGTIDQSVAVGQKIWLKSRCGKKGDLWPKILKR